MCKFASFIVTRERTYWSRTSDSHEVILWEFSLPDDSAKMVRVELVPKHITDPITEWEFGTDQRDIPSWYNAEWAESDVREEAANLLKARTITEDCEVTGGTWYVLAGSPNITQSGAGIYTYDKSKPNITQSGGWIETRKKSKPTITQSGGWIYTHDKSKPNITQSGGVILTYDNSKPTITQSSGKIQTCDKSKPNITQSGGWIRANDDSKPTITQSGGGVRTFDNSKPKITQSGGKMWAYDNSKPEVTKAKEEC